jgi:hypothetical protein
VVLAVLVQHLAYLAQASLTQVVAEALLVRLAEAGRAVQVVQEEEALVLITTVL